MCEPHGVASRPSLSPVKALLGEMGDRLLEGGPRYTKDAGVGKSEFEDKKKREGDAGRARRHRGDDDRIRFRKDSESEKQHDRPKDQNEDQTRTDRAARDLKGHQEPRSCDLIGEGAHGGERLLLFFIRRRERAEKALMTFRDASGTDTDRRFGSTESEPQNAS